MWDWFNENSAALQGLGGTAAVAAAVVAVFTLMRAGLDSATRTRPYIVAEYRVPELFEQHLYLVVRNAGPSAARAVSVKFDPQFALDEDSKRSGAARVARRYRTEIPTVAPGQELVSPLRLDLRDDNVNEVPIQLTVTVTYASPWWRGPFPYRDEFILAQSVFVEHVFTDSSESVRGRLKKIAEALDKLVKQQEKLAPRLTAIAGAVVESGRALSQPRSGVAWILRYKTGDTFELENLGDTTAFDVRLSAHDSLMGPDRVRGGPNVRPGGTMSFMAAQTLATRDDTISVSWTDRPDRDGTARRSTWSRSLPAGS